MDDMDRVLLDRVAVRDVFERYLQGLDRHDTEMIVGTFTDDVERTSSEGGSSGTASARDGFSRPGLGPAELDRTIHRTHLLGNFTVTIDGDEANGEAVCVSFLTGERTDAPHTLIRGIEYGLSFRRESTEWRICRLDHSLTWMLEATPVKS